MTAAPPATPGVHLRYRLFAMLYDALALLGIWVLTIVALVTASGQEATGWPVQALLGAQAYAFFTFFWVRRGQTLGMLAWRLAFAAPGGRITLRQAHLRLLGGALSLLCGGIGHFWMLIDSQRRGWPDLLSGSRVTRRPLNRG